MKVAFMFYPSKHELEIPILQSGSEANSGHEGEDLQDGAHVTSRQGDRGGLSRGSVKNGRRREMHGSSDENVERQSRALLVRLLNAARHPLAFMLAVIGMAKGTHDMGHVLECSREHAGRKVK